MKVLLIPLAGLALAAAACSSTEESTSTTQDPARVAAVAGTYAGTVPCADCEGIEYRLQLNPDFTWEDSRVYRGESEEPVERNGTFGFDESGRIVLDDDDDGFRYFKKTGRGLVLLDVEGREITGNLAARYVLTPTRREVQERVEPVAPGRDAELREEGVDFVAFGNEPSWTVKIDDETGMTFSGMGLTTISTPPVKPGRTQDANVMRYRGLTESHEIVVTVTGGECSDAMSGERFTHKVRVQARSTKEKNFREYNGCGKYIADARLGGAWQIAEVAGRKVDPSKYSKGAPELTFDLDQERVSAFAGCNRMTASFSTEASTIRFGKFASTMMSCPDMALEKSLGKALDQKTYTYTLTDESLVLTARDGSKIACRKPE